MRWGEWIAADHAQERSDAIGASVGPAFGAGTAWGSDAGHDPVAFGGVGYVGAYSSDNANPFVPANRRVVRLVGQEPVHVGATDSATGDVHHSGSGSRLWFGNLNEFEPAGSGNQTGEHQRWPFERPAVSARSIAGWVAHEIPRRRSS